MNYRIDHDYHIHSVLSVCSDDPDQSPARILRYAKEYGLKEICLTDHYWDESVTPIPGSWYLKQNTPHIKQNLPLPAGEGIRFRFGAEADIDDKMRLGLGKKMTGELEWIVIATTHLTMLPEHATAAERVKAYSGRLDSVLDRKDLPFGKIGIAHLACALISENFDAAEILPHIPDAEFHRLFAKAAKTGAGIEINNSDFNFKERTAEQIAEAIRVFGIAKEENCKFYLGSDAHHPWDFDKAMMSFEFAIRELGLTEENKYHITEN